ncbi:flagellar hook assembly protein FlgD [Rhodobacteraceae bacterium]|nr:flagellar hook assembly protein FlgD [Paracoccaceae bacterium]
MEISTQTALNTAQSNTAATASEDTTTSALSSDFETFLLMLTTQLQNQDPLNPVESEDFAVQLATFSGVEQQVRTNQLLENFAGGFGETSLAQLAGWVGMEARVTEPVSFSGTPVDLALSPASGSDAAELIVRNAFGTEVAREAVPLGQETIAWAGIGQNGNPLEAGSYSLELASIRSGEVTDVSAVSHYARITEARQGASGIELVLAGGSVLPSDAVTALRETAGTAD